MGNTGRFKFLTILCLVLFLFSFSFAQDKKAGEKLSEETKKDFRFSFEGDFKLEEIKEPHIHHKMLKKLNIEVLDNKESFFRRGEIVFFIAFGYLWMWQFIFYDQILKGPFNEGGTEGELEGRNFYFALSTSFIIALFVSRNDLQFYRYLKTGKIFHFPGAYNPLYDRNRRTYQWYFQLATWEF